MLGLVVRVLYLFVSLKSLPKKTVKENMQTGRSGSNLVGKQRSCGA